MGDADNNRGQVSLKEHVLGIDSMDRDEIVTHGLVTPKKEREHATRDELDITPLNGN